MTSLQSHFAGVDVSKDHLDLAVFGHDEVQRFENNSRGIKQLVHKLDKLDGELARLVTEASGGYEIDLCDALHAHGLAVACVNARCARDFAKATGRLAKTDAVDAKVLADFARVDQSALYSPPSPQMRELIELRRCRQNLVDRRAELSTQLKQARTKSVRNILERQLKALSQIQHSLEAKIRASLKVQPEQRESVKRLQTIPGVGQWTALALVCEVPELGTLNNKQVAKLVGVAPLNNDSGQRRGKASIWGGRARVRRLLYMAAMAAIRLEGPLKAHYEALRKGHRTHNGEQLECRPRMVALVAIMRKLAIYANVLMRDETVWDAQKLQHHA